jgi:hypothetical protein
MTVRPANILFIALLMVGAWSGAYALVTGDRVIVKLTEIDGRTLTTGDGVVTTLVLTTRPQSDKARQVGDRTPERCLGNPKYRMVTVVQFSPSTNRAMRYLLTKLALSRVNSEADKLKSRYKAKNLTTHPRPDIHVVFDFDGGIASQLGVKDSGTFAVFVFGPDGSLRRQWTTVPDAHELDAALQ